jgi:hypothetical protein
MGSPNVIALGGWKGKEIPVTFATPEEATILREAVNTYLRLYVHAGDASQVVCEEFIAIIDGELRDAAPAVPPQPSLSPASLDASAAAGPSYTFNVIADGDLTEWTATSGSPWLTVIDPLVPKTGDGTVLYAVAANATENPRTSAITISGLNLVFTVNQEAQPPQPSLSPTSLDASAAGGPSNLFNVIADGDPTEWMATADVAWLTVIDPVEPKTGDGTVLYAVAANTGASRNGTITISGLNLVFTVDQAAGA